MTHEAKIENAMHEIWIQRTIKLRVACMAMVQASFISQKSSVSDRTIPILSPPYVVCLCFSVGDGFRCFHVLSYEYLARTSFAF